MIRLIALDLDGTVLGPDVRPSRRDEEAIHAALARGVHVMLATGRTYTSGASYARELGLPPGPLIAYNGAEAREYPDGGMLLELPVPMAEAREVSRFVGSTGFICTSIRTTCATLRIELPGRTQSFNQPSGASRNC